MVRARLFRGLPGAVLVHAPHPTKRPREIIERKVPAIVDEKTWERAQKTLVKHRSTSSRNSHRRYLLRSLIKCGVCGLTYCGLTDHGARPSYQCKGKSNQRGRPPIRNERCPSKRISAEIEDVVWADIVAFLRNPGEVLQTLAEKIEGLEDDGSAHQRELEMIEAQLAEKDEERERILTLYRRGTIEAKLLDRQMEDIEKERQNI
ncbi:MAG: hypothetical protein GF355_03215, partial [Candidatus Eisenbacteria bacterium]|nr:hypothetical protein [Candidatus Eisenbacteria bacterium]